MRKTKLYLKDTITANTCTSNKIDIFNRKRKIIAFLPCEGLGSCSIGVYSERKSCVVFLPAKQKIIHGNLTSNDFFLSSIRLSIHNSDCFWHKPKLNYYLLLQKALIEVAPFKSEFCVTDKQKGTKLHSVQQNSTEFQKFVA